MSRIVASSILFAALVLGGCGDDDDGEAAGDVEAFCADFQSLSAAPRGSALGFTDERSVSEALLFFEQLQRNAPPEIADDISTLNLGLGNMVGAFSDFQGVEGDEALEAVQEAAEVDLEELSQAAENVEQFAIDNCEGVEAGE